MNGEVNIGYAECAQDSGKPPVIHAVVDAEANVDPPGLYLWNMARSSKIG